MKPVRQKHVEYIKQQGITSPAQLVAEARRTHSPLHELFNWNEKELVEAALLARARQILSVRMIVHTEHVSLHVPVFVRDVNQPKHKQGMSLVEEIKDDPDKALRTLQQELERVAEWLRRVQKLAVVFGMEKEMDDLILQLLGMVKAVKGKAA